VVSGTGEGRRGLFTRGMVIGKFGGGRRGVYCLHYGWEWQVSEWFVSFVSGSGVLGRGFVVR